MTNIKAPLIKQIEELKVKISKYTCTIEEAQADYDKSNEILERAMSSIDKITDADRDYLMTGNDHGRLIGDMETLAAFEHTMTLDLVHITTKYAIVSESLSSPAGYHPTSRVFVQPRICIQTNNPKPKAPSCNVPLYLSNLKECDAA